MSGAVLALLLLAAAPDGAALYQRHCTSCHAIEAGQDTAAGPTLHGVTTRAIAGSSGYDYSPAMRAFAKSHGRWTPLLLDRFLTGPGALVPGTEMGFTGLADPAERRALIDWLGRTAPSTR